MNDDLLYAIAAHAGVQRGFRDAHGQHVDSPPHAIAAILQALGHDVSSDAAREQTLHGLQTAARSPVATISVVRADDAASLALDGGGEVGWRLTCEDEIGRAHV